MIQVPEEVKALCMQDSINKNFRVSFPNGEYRDLVNEDIVAESVVFTESIGSTTGLQFGLCEGATLEFQTYFNQNIRNLKIKAGIEIDVSTLKIEGVNTSIKVFTVDRRDTHFVSYEAPYTGTYTFYSPDDIFDNSLYEEVELEAEEYYTLVVPPTSESGCPAGAYNVKVVIVSDDVEPGPPAYAEVANDVPFLFYSIPYGYFYVDSCKRNGQDAIRKVIAYQNKWELDNSPMFELSELERRKMCVCAVVDNDRNKYYTVDVLKFLCGCLRSVSILNPDSLESVTPSSELTMEWGVQTTNYHGSDYPDYWTPSIPRNVQTTYTLEGVRIRISSQSPDLLKNLYVLRYKNHVNLEKLADTILADLLEAFPNYRYLFTRERIYQYVFAPRFDFDVYIANLSYTTTTPINSSETSGVIQVLDPSQTVQVPANMWTRYTTPSRGGRSSYSRCGITEYISDSEIVFYPYYSMDRSPAIDGSSTTWMIDVPPFEVFIPVRLVAVTHKPETGSLTYTCDYTIMDVESLDDFEFLQYTPDTCNISFERQLDRGNYALYNLQLGTWRDKSYPGYGVEPPAYPNVCSLKYVATDTLQQYLNTKEITNSLVELQGGFLKLDRDSSFEVINLYGRKGLYPRTDLYPLDRTLGADALYPQGPDHLIARTLWRDVWYEDKPSNPYDKVCCTWRNDNDEEIYKEIILVDTSEDSMLARNYQHYDISNNYFIKTQGLLTEQQVDDVLNNLANILRDVQYYVSDVDMRGLPYMEAGDSISVLTRTSGFDTFCMRHRLSGIHALMDSIEAR